MGTPVVVVASGGLPVVNTPNGTPMEVAADGFGIPVTIAANGFGIAANLIGYSAGGYILSMNMSDFRNTYILGL